MVGVFMVQCPGPDQWAARDFFFKTATQVLRKTLGKADDHGQRRRRREESLISSLPW